MPIKKIGPRKIDPPHIIAQRKMAGMAVREILYGVRHPADAGKKTNNAWGFIFHNFCRTRLFTYEEVFAEARAFVEKNGVENGRGKDVDFSILRRFRAHLWERARELGRMKVGEFAPCQAEEGYAGKSAGIGTMQTALRAGLEAEASRAGKP